MPNLSSLSSAESAAFFNIAGNHVPVRLRRIQGGRVIWVNQRIMRDDPQFEEAGGTLDTYTAHLLRSCSYVIADDDSHAESQTIVGYADRYGGSGIGRNGGSGRAAVFNGYHVKGIGRTPLISALTDHAHASGGAYLEECVRETICSEIVASEFPLGSVPTLGIIETGQIQVWDEDQGPRPERRCLLVRPCFIRPAHFERASRFVSHDPKEGALDAMRVKHAIQVAESLWTRDGIAEAFRNFWERWAEQLAYAYIHRLPHGGSCTSNICLDGRLLDFGGMAAMPSLARAHIMLNGPPTGAEIVFVAQAVQAQPHFLTQYANTVGGVQMLAHEVLANANTVHQEVMVREVLRLAGLTRSQANALIAEKAISGSLISAVNRLLTHYQQEEFTIFDGTPSPRYAWDMAQLWSTEPPPHLVPLRNAIAQHFEVGQVAPMTGTTPAEISMRCKHRSTSRDNLLS